MKIQIIVAHHQKDAGHPLPIEYLKVCSPVGLVENSNFYEIFPNFDYFKQANPVWGEVIPLLKTDQSSAEITGLFHYRRFIVPTRFWKFQTINLDYRTRERVARTILKRIRNNSGQVFVPRAIDLSNLNRTVYTDFEINHRDSLKLLQLGALRLRDYYKDRGLEIDVLGLLKEQTKLHPYNIVIAPSLVFEQWRTALQGIVEELDSIGPEGELVEYQSRWGGFVIERLFSCWITVEKEHFGLKIQECPTVLFHDRLNFGLRRDIFLERLNGLYRRKRKEV